MGDEQTGAEERLRQRVDEHYDHTNPVIDWITLAAADGLAVLDELTRLRSRITDLETALGPFAARSDDDPDPTRTKRMFFLPIGELRAAARVLTKEDTRDG